MKRSLLMVTLLCVAASSLEAIPLTMEVTITNSPTAGQFRYAYTLTLDNNDNSWVAGQGWDWIAFGCIGSAAPASAKRLNGVTTIVPAGAPFTHTTVGGGVNGPMIYDTSPAYWVPAAINDSLSWTVDSADFVGAGENHWYTAQTTGGAIRANFEPVVVLNPGFQITPTPGTAPLVLNDEDGVGSIGYEAADFDITNNSSLFTLDVQDITIEARGNGTHTSVYSEVALYRDNTTGTVGSYDAGDILIGTAAPTFAGAPPEATFAVQLAEQTFPISTTRKYFVVVKLNGTGIAGGYYNYRVSDMTVDLGASGTAFGGLPSADMNGFQILDDEALLDTGSFVTGPATVLPTQTDMPVGAFKISATSTGPQAINSLTLNRTGTILDAEISAVKIWVDTNDNGVIDVAEVNVGGSLTYAGSSTTFAGGPLVSIPTSGSVNFIVTYSFTGISNGTTFGFDIAATDIGNTPGPAREVTAPTTPTFTATLVTAFPYTEDFDAFPYTGTTPTNPHTLIDGWWNDTTDGGLNWIPDYGGTSSSNSGPTNDHTTGGTGVGNKYLYVEDSNLNSGNDPMNLVTPAFDISALTAPVLDFWLHSTNNNNAAYENTLHFDLIDAVTGAVTLDNWTAFKGQLTVWTLQSLDLSAVTPTIVQIRFRVEATGSSFYNDMAIDDVRVWDPANIGIENSGNMAVAHNGTDNVGTILTASATTDTYTITNTGQSVLTLGGAPAVTFSNHSNIAVLDTTLTTAPPATVAASGTGTFTISYLPGTGAFSFDVTIASDDPDTPAYTFTISGTGQSNVSPIMSIPATGSNWLANGNNFELTVNPGATIADALTATDATPDLMTITVTPPATMPATLTSSPVTTTQTVTGPFSFDWAGTLTGMNTPGSFVWTIAVTDGVSTLNFTATIIIRDLAPTHAIGTSATTGDGLASGTAYATTALVGSTAALTMATVSDPNGSQTPTFVSATADAGNPAGGSGFTATLSGTDVLMTPASALVLADVGTHTFEVVVTDGTTQTSVWVSVQVVTPEIDVANGATAIANNGTDTVTGAAINVPSSITYTITNSGTSDLTIASATTANATGCTPSVTTTPAAAIAPAGTDNVIVSVTPTLVGAFSFDLVITSDDVDESPYTITISGTAVGSPEIDVIRSSTSIASGATDAVGNITQNTSRTFVYTIDNSAGTSDLTITATTTGSDVDCTSSVTVTPAATVTAGNTTSFEVQIDVTTGTTFSTVITITNNDANEGTYVINVSGSIVAPSSSSSGGGGGCAASASSNYFWIALLGLLSIVAVLRRQLGARQQ